MWDCLNAAVPVRINVHAWVWLIKSRSVILHHILFVHVCQVYGSIVLSGLRLLSGFWIRKVCVHPSVLHSLNLPPWAQRGTVCVSLLHQTIMIYREASSLTVYTHLAHIRQRVSLSSDSKMHMCSIIDLCIHQHTPVKHLLPHALYIKVVAHTHLKALSLRRTHRCCGPWGRGRRWN